MNRILFEMTQKSRLFLTSPAIRRLTATHNTLSLLTKSSPKLANVQFRNLASEHKTDASAVGDKQQWERDDRYKIFYGFNDKDEAEDKTSAHFFTFIGIFGFIFMPCFLLYYYPDYKTNDWCRREAYLELARREASGEALINRDYVPSDKIKLPTDEELGDTQISI